MRVPLASSSSLLLSKEKNGSAASLIADHRISGKDLVAKGFDGLVFEASFEQKLIFQLVLGIMYTIVFPIRLVLALINTLFVNKPASDKKIIQSIKNTLLCLLVQPGTKSKYMIDVNSLLIPTYSRFPLKSLQVHFDDDKIESAIWNGNEVTDKMVIHSLLVMYLVTSQHTKTHVASSRAIRIIRARMTQKEVKENLLPETLFVTEALHDRLLFSSFSPLRINSNSRFYSIMERESLVDEGKNWSSFMHIGLQTLREEPFVKMLRYARRVMAEELKLVGLADLTEPLFSHTILHAWDHVSGFESVDVVKFCLGLENQSFAAVFGSEMFKLLFVGPTLNPFASNLMKDSKSPLFHRIHKRVHELYPKWADVMTGSVMY